MNEPDATRFAKNLLVTIGETHEAGRILTKQELLELTPPLQAPQMLVPVSATIPAKQMSSKLEIIRDPSKEIGTRGSIDDFSHYFRDRFHKLSSAFRDRYDARDAANIASALAAEQNQKVKFIAMVMEKRERQGKLFIQIDDLEDSATVLVSEDCACCLRSRPEDSA